MKSRQNQVAMTIGTASLFGAFALVSEASAQNVGIGFSNPASKLTVNGNFAVGADYNSVAPTNGAIIEGAVGIGTTSSTQMLQVFNGNIYCNGAAGDSSILLVNNDGGIRVVRNGSAYTSDSPFNNGYIDFVQPLRYGLREIMSLEPKEYDFHTVQSMIDGKPKFAAGELHQLGFLAQQVVKVLPEAVEKPADPKTEFYRMGYSSFIPVLVSAVQELKHLQDETVAQQEAKITRQETKIAPLESEVASLKQANHKLAAMTSKLEALEKAVNNLQIKDSSKEQAVAINANNN